MSTSPMSDAARLEAFKAPLRAGNDWCSICDQPIIGRIPGTLVRCNHNPVPLSWYPAPRSPKQ